MKSVGTTERVLMYRDLPGGARLPYYARVRSDLRFPDQVQSIYGTVQDARPSSQVTPGGHRCTADEVTIRPAECTNLARFHGKILEGVEYLLKQSDERQEPKLQTPKLTSCIYQV